jgi:glycerol-3-phosphate dehydrogenase
MARVSGMQRNPAELADGEFDLAIIGGGAFGAAAAWDASLRGLRTALIERKDFGGGASAECFKMVHGGIRYLQHLDIGRLRSSCRERSALLRIAPHLVSPLPIVIPTYGRGRKGKLFLGTGMRLYDLLTFDRNAGVADGARRIPATRFLGREQVRELFPDLDDAGLTGGAVFDDGQMYSPPRLVLAFLKSAAGAGATACNYVEATGFLWDGNRVRGVRARDRLDGSVIDIRARLVLNAAGPGAEYLLGDARFGAWRRGAFSRDACFVVRRKPRSPFALAIQGRSRDRNSLVGRETRHMFIVPWRDFTLVGVWHRLFADHPDATAVEDGELEGWIREINDCYPAMSLSEGDVVYRNCGLVPFGDGSVGTSELSFGKESRFIDHRRMHGIEGLVTLIGIRYTTARGDAGRALDLLLEQMPAAPRPPGTERHPLAGGDIEDFGALRTAARRAQPEGVDEATLERLLHNHGTAYEAVLSQARAGSTDTRGIDGAPASMAEVTHAVREEMAIKLEDVVLRRTDLGSGSHPGAGVLGKVAARMGELLGWSGERASREVEDTEVVLRRHGAATAAAA